LRIITYAHVWHCAILIDRHNSNPPCRPLSQFQALNITEQARQHVEQMSYSYDYLPFFEQAVSIQLGHVRHHEMPHIYSQAHAFVLPSRGEGWGRPYMEAMSMQLPVGIDSSMALLRTPNS
jgi:glycosyltransferase involved in cell wall biosynthesis